MNVTLVHNRAGSESEPSAPRQRQTGFRRLPLGAGFLRIALAALVVAAGALGALAWLGGGSSASEVVPPQVREFTLVAQPIKWEIEQGIVVDAWAYNGQVPGPEIRVREGDTVRVKLVNNLPAATTIHWHGIDNTPEMDGPAGLNQAPVEPGQEFVYEWVADPAGSRMYHSHTDVHNQVALGLYGPLVVEPRDSDEDRAYDREYTIMLNEWDLELTPDVVLGKAPKGPGDQHLRGGELGADLFLMNGHAHDAIPPVALAEGERVLIRLMNLGNMPHPIHTHGHSFRIVATDGNPVPEGLELTKDTVLIAPGERYDLELVGDNPGVWMFHCHIENHADNGMMSLIAYDGAVPTGPLAATWGDGSTGMGMVHGSHVEPAAGAPNAETQPVDPAVAPETTPEPTPEAAAPTPTPAVTAEAPASGVDTAAGKTVEVAINDNSFNHADLTVAPGTTVVWVNRGKNMHSVASFDGLFASVTLKPGETYSYTFEQPGTFRYICKQHGRQGMLGRVTVA
jgi:FtsP/CotA-like multicopper oxidase with cupredoxin domain